MKILVCNTGYAKAVARLKELLPEHEIITCESDDVINHLKGVEVLIPTMASIDADVIKKGEFGLVHQLGTGLDTVDMDAATAAGVWVARVRGSGSGNAESVAEHAILLMLALSRQLPQAMQNVKDGVFFKPTGTAFFGKNVCIVGLGDIGCALAMRLKPFEVHMTAVREHPEKSVPGEFGIDMVYGHNDLHQAISSADYVVLAIPESKKNRKLIDKDALYAMKPGAFVINVCRGGVIDNEALTEALADGHIAGAGLDVFWEEPVDANHPIFKQNVIATPHIAGNTDASLDGVTTVLAENIKWFAQGKRPIHTVNSPTHCRSIAASV
jgi:phosphoglycerate dehydrogenase-like enzyme